MVSYQWYVLNGKPQVAHSVKPQAGRGAKATCSIFQNFLRRKKTIKATFHKAAVKNIDCKQSEREFSKIIIFPYNNDN